MDNDISPASLVRTLVIVTWLTLNLAVNFYNKWAFTPDDDLHHGPGFSFPIFYTMWNMVASFAGANLLMLGVPSSRTISWKQFWRHKWALLLLSCVSVLNITLQNASLVQIGLSVNQMIKCCVPLPAMVFSALLEHNSYPASSVAAVVAIVVGAVLAVPYSDRTVTAYGLSLVLVSTLMAALRPVLTALLMSSARENGLSPIPLLWYDSLISVLVLLCAFFASEERPTLVTYFESKAALGASILLVGSLMSFVFNLASFYLIKHIGALTSTILGNLKTVVLIMGAVLFIDSQILSGLNVFGYVVFFIALFTYSYLNYRRRVASSTPVAVVAAAPAAAEGGKPHGRQTERSTLLARSDA